MNILLLILSIAVLRPEQVNLTINITPPAEVETVEATSQTAQTATQGAAGLTGEEIDLIARTVQAEAGGEDETGKRLIVAVIINRMRSDSQDFKSQTTVTQVIGAPNQFTTADWASAEVYDAVYKELADPTDDRVLWFASNGYQPYGTQLYQHGGHYFNGQ